MVLGSEWLDILTFKMSMYPVHKQLPTRSLSAKEGAIKRFPAQKFFLTPNLLHNVKRHCSRT